MKLKIYELKCKFCGKQCGTYKYPEELKVSDLGIADVRCSACEKTKGTYKEELVKAELEKSKLKLGGITLKKTKKRVKIKKK